MALRVGIIGAGEIASIHAEALIRAGAQLVACYDRDFQKARVLADKFGATPLLDVAEVIAAADVIYICTRHDSHAVLVQQVAAAGRAIFVEKPLAMDLASAEVAARAVTVAGVPFGIGFNHRWAPANAAAFARMVVDRVSPYHILVRVACPPFMDGWAGSVKEGGGVLVCLGSHGFDLLEALHPRSRAITISCVTARQRLPPGAMPDTAAAWVRMADGCLATVILHDHSPPSLAIDPGGQLLSWEVTASGRTYRGGSLQGWQCWSGDVGTPPKQESPVADPLERWGYAPQARAFLTSLATHRAYPVGITAGLRAAALVEAAARSAALGGAPTPVSEV